jgi:hypothetical protein
MVGDDRSAGTFGKTTLEILVSLRLVRDASEGVRWGGTGFPQRSTSDVVD